MVAMTSLSSELVNATIKKVMAPLEVGPDIERRGGTSRLGVSLETHAEIVSKAEVKAKL